MISGTHVECRSKPRIKHSHRREDAFKYPSLVAARMNRIEDNLGLEERRAARQVHAKRKRWMQNSEMKGWQFFHVSTIHI